MHRNDRTDKNTSCQYASKDPMALLAAEQRLHTQLNTLQVPIDTACVDLDMEPSDSAPIFCV